MNPPRPAWPALAAVSVGMAILCGCDAQPEVLFTAVRDNAAVLSLTDVQDICDAGGRLAYLTNETGTLNGCWVRAKGDIRASFAGIPEIRVATQAFRATEQAERRRLVVDSFEESPLYAAGVPTR